MAEVGFPDRTWKGYWDTCRTRWVLLRVLRFPPTSPNIWANKSDQYVLSGSHLFSNLENVTYFEFKLSHNPNWFPHYPTTISFLTPTLNKFVSLYNFHFLINSTVYTNMFIWNIFGRIQMNVRFLISLICKGNKVSSNLLNFKCFLTHDPWKKCKTCLKPPPTKFDVTISWVLYFHDSLMIV